MLVLGTNYNLYLTKKKMGLEDLIKDRYHFTSKVVTGNNRRVIPVPPENSDEFEAKDNVMVINLDKKRVLKKNKK